MQMKTLAMSMLTGLAVLTSTHAWSGQKSQPQKAIEGSMLVQDIGTVNSIDPATSRLTVATAQGTTVQWQLTPGAHDLGSIPIGSRVTRTDNEPVSLTPLKTGAVQEVVPGDKQFVLRVVGADSASGVVHLKDANDLPFEVRTRDPQQAAKFATGSLVKVKLDDQKAKAEPKK
jgi:hypothetical protein